MKLKRCLVALAALTMACAVLPMAAVPETVITASAEELTYEKLTYVVQRDGTIEISGCEKDAVSVEIPGEIEGKRVTRIRDAVFYECTSLTDITIPDSVTSIGEWAFCETPWLTAKQEENPLVIVNGILIDGSTCSGAVTIPDGVTSIGAGAFFFCDNLTSVTIPDGVTSIGDRAFYNCKNLTSVTIPDGVMSIGIQAFQYTSLIDITIPDSVTSIWANAFCETPWLTAKQEENPLVIVNGILIDGSTCSGAVTIPDGVTSIGSDAFCDCENLTSVTIPDGVTSIGDKAFYNCKNLTDITVLNPDCAISIYSQYVICNIIEEIPEGDGGYYIRANFTGTIHGYEGSTMQAYAENNSYKFESLGAAPEMSALELGNVNGDEKIDASDAADLLIALAAIGAGGDSGLTEEQTAAADADGNGTLDAGDAATILQYAAFLGSGGTGTLADFLKS